MAFFAPSVQFCPRFMASSGSDAGYLFFRTCTAVHRQFQPFGGRNMSQNGSDGGSVVPFNMACSSRTLSSPAVRYCKL